MRKRMKLLATMLVLSMVMFLMAGCGRSVKVGTSANSDKQDKKSDKNSSKDKIFDITDDDIDDDSDYDLDDEEETTKKSSSSKNNSSKNNSSKDNSSKDNSSKKNNSTSNTSSWKSYSGDGYSVKLSSDWSKTKGSSVVDIAFTYNGTGLNGDFAENINVVVQDLKGYDLDLESYKDLSMDQYAELDYNVDDIYKKTIDGAKGYFCKVSGEESGINCSILQYFTVIGDNAYVFTFAADEDDFDNLEDEVMEIYETIEFDNVKGA
jgi:outer membrane biogenesis lipoprotein LolB